MLNLKILANPINWVKVPLMAFTFMIGVFLIQKVLTRTATDETEDE